MLKPSIVAMLTIVFIAGCAQQPLAASSGPGFWMGLLHGFMVPGSLIAAIWDNVRIYAFPNSGVLYDIGFTIGGFTISCLIFLFVVRAIFGE
jgi:hypothetical protein